MRGRERATASRDSDMSGADPGSVGSNDGDSKLKATLPQEKSQEQEP